MKNNIEYIKRTLDLCVYCLMTLCLFVGLFICVQIGDYVENKYKQNVNVKLNELELKTEEYKRKQEAFLKSIKELEELQELESKISKVITMPTYKSTEPYN